MRQSDRLLQELKSALRQRQLDYAAVAIHLGLSESSVKRLFSKGGFTLERLEAVCELADVDLLELARRTEDNRRQLAALTASQEQEVVSDPALLLVAICALNRWRFADIAQTYNFTEPELIGHLVRLDRLGLLELLPNNRIRLRVTRNFAWLPQGPIHRYFIEHVQDEFLAGEFLPGRDAYRFTWGMMSLESAAALREKIQELMETFDARSRQDEVRGSGSATGTCLLVAFRDWEPQGFQSMRRQRP